MHGMSQGSEYNSWKLKMSQFFHGLHTHKTCHPLSTLGMLWNDVYDSVFQFPPISNNFAQPLKRRGTTFHRPQSTAWSTLCEWDVSHWLHEANGGHTRYWTVFRYLKKYIFFKVYLWPTESYLYSQSFEIHRFGHNLFISVDWFPYMNCNTAKSLRLLHVAFLFLFSINCNG